MIGGKEKLNPVSRIIGVSLTIVVFEATREDILPAMGGAACFILLDPLAVKEEEGDTAITL